LIQRLRKNKGLDHNISISGNDFGVTAKSKNSGCCNRNVTANDENELCGNNSEGSSSRKT